MHTWGRGHWVAVTYPWPIPDLCLTSAATEWAGLAPDSRWLLQSLSLKNVKWRPGKRLVLVSFGGSESAICQLRSWGVSFLHQQPGSEKRRGWETRMEQMSRPGQRYPKVQVHSCPWFLWGTSVFFFFFPIKSASFLIICKGESKVPTLMMVLLTKLNNCCVTATLLTLAHLIPSIT